MAKAEGGRSRGAGRSKKGGGPKKLGADIVNLASRKGAGVPDGSNSGNPVATTLIVGAKDTEAFLVWEGKIKRQWAMVQKAKKVVQSETSSLGGLYAQAKEAGIPAQRISTLKKRLKLEERPIEDVVAEHQEMAWQVNHVKASPLKQLGLFDVSEPTLEGYEMIGEKAGLEGGHIDNAPGQQGEDRYTAWLNGFKRGQKKLAEDTFNAGEKVDNDGAGEEELVS